MPAKVLIIDDDADTLRLVSLMLQHQGYEICTALSGALGLGMAAQEHPDVILLDVMMPEMDGIEVARELRARPDTRATPILMFTAKAQLEDRVAAFEAGADDYLTKPTNPGELQSHVRHLLERGQQNAQPTAATTATPTARRKICVLAARSGMGVSALAVNLAAAMQMRSQQEVILVELTPGQGTLCFDLGIPSPRGLSELLALAPEAITPDRVLSVVMRHNSGLRVLLSSENPRDAALAGRTAQFEAVFHALDGAAPFLIIDLGSALPAWAATIAAACQEQIVVTEAAANTLQHTRLLLDEMAATGVNIENTRLVLNHRVRFDTQFPTAEAEHTLAHPISTTLRPAPELMTAAARRHQPGVLVMPEDPLAQQVLRMADMLLEATETSKGEGDYVPRGPGTRVK